MKRGDVYVLTRGDYDSYEIVGIVRAVRTFDFDAEVAAFKNLPRGEQEYPTADKFVPFLVARGLVVEDGRASELHLGYYSAMDNTPEADRTRRVARVAEILAAQKAAQHG